MLLTILLITRIIEAAREFFPLGLSIGRLAEVGGVSSSFSTPSSASLLWRASASPQVRRLVRHQPGSVGFQEEIKQENGPDPRGAFVLDHLGDQADKDQCSDAVAILMRGKKMFCRGDRALDTGQEVRDLLLDEPYAGA
jgi:hypothetical protein